MSVDLTTSGCGGIPAVAIVQARMGSSRLPAKVLQDIGGDSMLARVVQRLKACREIERVVVATTTRQEDSAIVSACHAMDIPVTRGSEHDVLDRYVQAARAHAADVIVRVTSDCPLIDPDVCAHVIAEFRYSRRAVDYASNKIPQSYPRGLDVEVFTRSALERAWNDATEGYQRAHVTPYIYEHPECFGLLSVVDSVDRAEWRWTVDTPEDLTFVREIYARFEGEGQFTWRDVVALVDQEPQLAAINRHVQQKRLEQG